MQKKEKKKKIRENMTCVLTFSTNGKSEACACSLMHDQAITRGSGKRILSMIGQFTC